MPFEDSKIGRGYTLTYKTISRRVELIRGGMPIDEASRLALKEFVPEEKFLELGMHPISSSIRAGFAGIFNHRLFFRNYRPKSSG